MSLRNPPAWTGPSADPNDEQFGHLVDPAAFDEVERFDVVLVGEPYDGAVIGRSGAHEGPATLREALASLKTHHFDAGPVGSGGSIGDLGDVEIPEGDVDTVQDAIREMTREIHSHDTLPVFLGGDNSLTYPNVAPLLSESVGVVSFDAHLDCREVRSEPTSGTPYRQLHEDGLDAFAVLGARHFETSTAYHEYVRDQGGTVITSEAVGDDGASTVDRALDAMNGVEIVYVSLDLDVLDTTAAPGVSAPTPGGISTRELFAMIRRIAADDRVVGFEVVECAPSLDFRGTSDEGRTAAAGAHAIAHFLAGYTMEERND